MRSEDASRMSLSAIIFTVFAATAIVAQSPTGRLHATLTDSPGTVIPSAKIRVADGDGEKAVSSGANGTFVLNGLHDGDFKVLPRLPGFISYEKAVTITPGVSSQLDIQLTPGGATQEVNVSAKAETDTVQPEHNDSATVVKDSDLDALPDDPDDLSDMLTALADPSADVNDATLMVNGFEGFPCGTLPPKNTIKEIHISQNPFLEDFHAGSASPDAGYVEDKPRRSKHCST